MLLDCIFREIVEREWDMERSGKNLILTDLLICVCFLFPKSSKGGRLL